VERAVAEARAQGARVVMAGFVPDGDLAALYSAALGFVFPSLHEGFGIPPLEAMQCGTPVIASNRSSIPEVVGDAALVVDPQDADALSHAMYRLYNEPVLREDLRARSLARAALFSWDRTAAETLAVYRAAIAA
jgi:glycosyltransferase involved in cell wall biosynthesis